MFVSYYWGHFDLVVIKDSEIGEIHISIEDWPVEERNMKVAYILPMIVAREYPKYGLDVAKNLALLAIYMSLDLGKVLQHLLKFAINHQNQVLDRVMLNFDKVASERDAYLEKIILLR